MERWRRNNGNDNNNTFIGLLRMVLHVWRIRGIARRDTSWLLTDLYYNTVIHQ
jgi:hypothetical protein